MKHGGEPNVFSPLPSLNSFFNDPQLRDWFSWGHDTAADNITLPAVNIYETENAFEIALAAPGMTKNDFKIELENNRLVISGEKKENTHDTDQKRDLNWLRREYNYSSFVRSFTISERQVKAENIKASYTDGILQITVPKSAEAKSKAARLIQIS
jgi:HSP20 family protein